MLDIISRIGLIDLEEASDDVVVEVLANGLVMPNLRAKDIVPSLLLAFEIHKNDFRPQKREIIQKIVYLAAQKLEQLNRSVEATDKANCERPKALYLRG